AEDQSLLGEVLRVGGNAMSVTVDVDRPSEQKPRAKRKVRQGWRIAGFLAPAVILLIVVRVWPGLTALWLSVTSGFSIEGESGQFIGLDNFRFLLQDPFFVETMGRTLLFNIVINPLQVLLALLLAWFLTQRVHLVGVWRALLVLPITVPIVG